MICTFFIIVSSLTLIFYLSLPFWMLKIASSLALILHLSLFLGKLATILSFDYHSLFIFVGRSTTNYNDLQPRFFIFIGRSIKDYIVLQPRFCYVFYLMDVGNPLFVTSVCCLSLFLELKNEEKEFVSVLRLSIDYYTF